MAVARKSTRRIGSLTETDFIGRRAELSTIRRNLDDIASGMGKVIAVIGDPGIGKSRIIQKVVEGNDDFDYLEGHCLELRENDSFYFLGDVLKRRFNSVDALKREVVDELGLKEEFFILNALYLAANGKSFSLSDLPSDIVRKRINSAFANYLQKLSERSRPPILVVEDAHWIDDDSAEVVNGLAPVLAGRTGILYTNRTTEAIGKVTVANLRDGSFELVYVDPFSDVDARKLMRQYDVDEEKILEDAEGVPIKLEHIALARRFGIEGGSLDELINGRIDSLGEDVRHEMEIISLINEDFSSELLAYTLDRRVNFGRLISSRLVRKVRDDRYVVDHQIVADAVKSVIRPNHRPDLHLVIADSYETNFPLAEVAESVAYHLTQEGVLERDLFLAPKGPRRRAVNALTAAANKARSIGAADAAERKYRLALDLLAPVEVEDKSLKLNVTNLKAVVGMDLCNLLDERGDSRLYGEREGVANLVAGGDCSIETSYRAAFGLALSEFEKGNFDAALKKFSEVEKIVNFRYHNLLEKIESGEASQSDLQDVVNTMRYSAMIEINRGRVFYTKGLVAPSVDLSLYNSAVSHLSDAETKLAALNTFATERGIDLDTKGLSAIIKVTLARAYTEKMDFDPALQNLGEAERLCDQSNLVIFSEFYLNARARYLARTLEREEAEKLYQRGLAFVEREGLPLLQLFLHEGFGRMCQDRNDKENAKLHYEKALGVIEQRGRDIYGYKAMLERKLNEVS